MRPSLLLPLGALLAAAPAQAQTCSDGTTGVRVSLSRVEAVGDSLRICLALAGDPAQTVGLVAFLVYEQSMAMLRQQDTMAAPSVYNTPPYGVFSGRCLGSPMCDGYFFTHVSQNGGVPKPFTADPAEFVCHTYVVWGPRSAAGIAVRDVVAQHGDGGLATVCPPGDQATWGVPVAGEAGPDATALALDATPNPVRGTATVGFVLPAAGPARLVLLDALGREVAMLAEGTRAAGRSETALETGALAPGAYLLRLEAGGAVAVRRLTVVR